MKTNLFLFALIASIGLFSCETPEENPNEAQLYPATISGKVQANYDLRNDTNFTTNLENVGDVKVIAIIDGSELVHNPGPFDYPVARYETETASDGTYSIDVEVLESGSNVSVRFSTIYINKYEADSSRTNDVAFSAANQTVNLVAGETRDVSTTLTD